MDEPTGSTSGGNAGESASKAAEHTGFPDLVVALDAAEIRRRMDLASRRGRVPGVHVGEGDTLFEVDGCGAPFEHHLVATGTPADGAIRVSFALVRRNRMPLVFAILLVVTVWPGVYFMDQLIPGEWNWIPTWTWYLPLTVLPVPWFWRSTARKSHAIALEDSRGLVEKIRVELGSAGTDRR
jgi:hypothetical protein